MKKNFFVKTCLIMALVLSALCVLSSCKKNKDENKKIPDNVVIKTPIGDTTHTDNTTESDIKLVENGTTQYTVVYPNGMANETKMIVALNEMKNLFFEATGITVSVKSDAEYVSDEKILSVGLTEQAKSKTDFIKKMSDFNIGNDGYVIETIGESVYMAGKTAAADLYSVYEFLSKQFAFEAYASNVYYIDTNVKNRALLNFDLVDIPDFAARTACNSEGICDRFRTISYTDGFNNADGNTFVHNYYNLVPPSLYSKEHPEWFYGSGHTGQLCLEAHGDAQSRLLLKDVVVRSLIERLEAQPDIDWIAFSHNDGGKWCNCAACTRDADLYDQGANTAAFASVIRFVNLVAKDIKQWNETKCPERDITIFIYDYGYVTWAPVKLDANKKPVLDKNGEYQPYSEDLILEDNVAIYWCGFGPSMAQLPLSDELCQSFVDRLKRSNTIMRNPARYIWNYSANFSNYFTPCNTVCYRQERYQMFKSFGAVGIFDQAQFDNSKTADFGALKSYVSAKLMWNCQEDVSILIDDFFKNYYGEAYAAMKNYYNEYCSYISYIVKEKDYGANSTSASAKYFPYPVIIHFQDLTQKAYDAIELLKFTEPTRYKALHDRIMRDGLSWRYLELVLYPNNYTTDKLAKLQDEFLRDAMSLGITQCSENNAIGNIFG